MFRLASLLVFACVVTAQNHRKSDLFFDWFKYLEILDLHNNLRRTEAYQEGVGFMKETKWSEDLAAEAHNYTKMCTYQLDRPGSEYEVSYGFGPKWKSWKSIYNSWYANKAHYNFLTTRCSASDPRKCAQYLNIVKFNAQEFGCGINYCRNGVANVEPEQKETHFFVCLYSNPAVNSESGKKYFVKPYNKRQCMQCDGNTHTYSNGLCARTS